VILDHIVTLRGGPVDGKTYRVPIPTMQMVIQEQHVYGASVDSTAEVPTKTVKHLYESTMVVQGNTISTEFLYRGVVNV